jgi:oxygen-independent coproporphyrinogen-3 oxidase
VSGTAGVYLHVPFCAAICPYCDFAVARGDAPARDRFTAALVAELAASSAALAGPFDTVYLGGGTPSYLEPRQLETILDAVRSALPIEGEAFVVMEANPEDVTRSSVAAWRDLGVLGLSLGVQSFDAGVLRFLGRRHRGDDARRAVELALESGFPWVSLDLIYGSPAPARDALADVETAIRLAPHHISCYQLTVHDGTPFAAARDRGRLTELSNDAQATLFLAVHDALAAGGYPAYEVSNFARGAEHRSRHNTKYWRHAPYLGLGPSAHSFDGARRWWNVKDWREWAAAVERGAPPLSGSEILTVRDLALEALMLGLRMADGVAIDAYRERHGIDLLGANRERIARAAAEGLLLVEERWLRPTSRGLAVADALAASFDLEGSPSRQNGRGAGEDPGAPSEAE